MSDSSALTFLMAAKHCEMAELGALARTVDLVGAVADLVHQLQRERGCSSLVLGSGHTRFLDDLVAQQAATDRAYAAVALQLERLHPQQGREALPSQGARLYAALAQALQCHAALPALRLWRPSPSPGMSPVTQAYIRLVGAWLGVVFEAADIAVDAEVSRHLVCLFHLMQAKEQAGQERARGSALFAAGAVTEDDRLLLRDLLEAQQRSVEASAACATDDIAQALQAWHEDTAVRDRQALRRWLLEPTEHGALNRQLSPAWFEACTACMDALKAVELRLIEGLRQRCQAKAARWEQELDGLQRWVPQTPPGMAGAGSDSGHCSAAPASAEQALAFLLGAPASAPQQGPQMMALVQSQTQRLMALSAELDAAREALRERKLLERAKGVLMAQTGLSEEAAYRRLRQAAMDSGMRLGDLAEEMLRRTNPVR